MMIALIILSQSPMSNKRPFADLPLPLLWFAILFLGVPAVIDVSTELTTVPLAAALAHVGKLVFSLFLLFCAVQIHRGNRASLAAPSAELVGKACMALFVIFGLAKWVFRA
jgi:hypothetical protein